MLEIMLLINTLFPNVLLQTTSIPNVIGTGPQYVPLCSSYGYVNKNDWININVLVVLTFIMISALVYAISGILPIANRERLRGVVKHEAVEGVLSILIIVALVTITISACNVGSVLSGQASTFQDPFQYSHQYLGHLLFSTGVGLTTDLYAKGLTFLVDGYAASYLGGLISSAIPDLKPIPGFKISIGLSGVTNFISIFYGYNSVLSLVYATFIVLTFGLLFVLLLTLPIVESLAFTVVLPIAIIMRSLSFTGPRLREASNTVIAITIAFYIVLPLTITMTNFITNWTYCIGNGNNPCNPYSYYLQGYKLGKDDVPVTSIFTDKADYNGAFLLQGTPINLPINVFYKTISSGSGGTAQALKNLVVDLFFTPYAIDNFSLQVSQYLFQGIILFALDIAIVVGFAQGLSRGLNSVSRILGTGPFLGG